MPELQIDDVTKDYGATRALHPATLTVEKGEFVTILGPSGCGKSTLLRILMGITAHTAGEIRLAGTRIDGLPPEKRDVAMVFQSYALFPHLTVRGNIAFGLRMKKVPKPERAKRLAAAVEICNLGPYLDRMPRQLSGGQQQRVALARAIVLEPRLLLFDEPLSNLDAKLRDSLRHDLVDLHRRTGATSLYVTHDQAEAMAMSDRIVVMNNGRIVETGTPVELYRAPRHAFTAAFLGQTNLVAAKPAGAVGELPWGELVPLSRRIDGPAMVSIRPEAIAVTPDPAGTAVVTGIAFMGAHVLYTLAFEGLTLRANRAGAEDLVPLGASVALSVTGTAHVVDGTVGGAA